MTHPSPAPPENLSATSESPATDPAGIAAKTLAFWPVFAIVLVADVVTKQIAVQSLIPHVPRRVIGDWVKFTLAYNPGMAFSWHVGSASRWVFSIVALLVLFLLWRLFRETRRQDVLRGLALGMVCAGAIGNLLDRIRSARGVVDFVDVGVGSWRFYTFNVADAGVTIGAILLAWSLWREGRRERARA